MSEFCDTMVVYIMYFYAYGGKYMGSTIVKRNTYRLVDSNSFELPVPFRFEVMKKDVIIAEYEIIDGENAILLQSIRRIC